MTIPCGSQRAERQHTDRPRSTALDTITKAWSIAGAKYGAGIGAAYGGIVTLFGGLWFVAWLGVVVGGVLGTFLGLGVGAVNGVTITWLSRTRAWTMEPERRRRRAAWTSVATTALAIIALQLVLFRSLGGQTAFVFLDAPGAVGAAAVVHLSRRLLPLR